MDLVALAVFGSLLDMLAFYQVFMIYRIFFAESFHLSTGRIAIITGIAFCISFISMLLGTWSVVWSMLFIVIIMGKRKIRESILIVPAIMVYVVLGIIPVMMLREIITIPNSPFILTIVGADWLGLITDVIGCIAVTILYRIVRKHKVSLVLRPLEILGFGLFFLFEIFLLMGIAVIRVHYEGTTQLLLNASCLFFFLVAMGAYLWQLITLRRVRRLNVLVKQEEVYIQ